MKDLMKVLDAVGLSFSVFNLIFVLSGFGMFCGLLEVMGLFGY